MIIAIEEDEPVFFISWKLLFTESNIKAFNHVSSPFCGFKCGDFEKLHVNKRAQLPFECKLNVNQESCSVFENLLKDVELSQLMEEYEGREILADHSEKLLSPEFVESIFRREQVGPKSMILIQWVREISK